MKKILLFGAGKSATVLIDYLLQAAATEDWQLLVADTDLKTAEAKLNNSKYGKALRVDITNNAERNKVIAGADIVISLLPPSLHYAVAADCITYSKNLLTASYIDDNIRGLRADIEKKGLLFLCEMGLDPGIDHMSAMQMIDGIHSAGGTITSFKSHCGGLVAPESDDNPWHYKISWNPRNIVLAGKAGAVFKKDGKKIAIAYDSVFENCPEITVKGLPVLAAYPNRDSLSYASLYSLEGAATFVRTTLRYASFCRGWDCICHLGLTDTDDEKEITKMTTVHEWFHHKLDGIELRKMEWMEYLKLYVTEKYHTEITEQFDYLDLFETRPLPANAKCSADILQHLLESRLTLAETDRDMIVMLHEIESTIMDEKSSVRSLLIATGEDSLRTAMAKTVGLPLGIAARLILQNKIKLTGLLIPIVREIYEPVLRELESFGIRFSEERAIIT